jgi:hypothetical protein
VERANGHTKDPEALAEAVARGESTAGHTQSPAIMPRGWSAGHLFADQAGIYASATPAIRLEGEISGPVVGDAREFRSGCRAESCPPTQAAPAAVLCLLS